MPRNPPPPLDLTAKPAAPHKSGFASLPRTPHTAFEDTNTIETFGYDSRSYDPRGDGHRFAIKAVHKQWDRTLGDISHRAEPETEPDNAKTILYVGAELCADTVAKAHARDNVVVLNRD